MLFLLLLRVYLFALVPANFAIEALKTLPSLDLRGMPAVLELAVHGAAAAFSAAAGWMIYVRNPAAPRLALIAVTVNAAVTIQTLFWSVLPHDIPPGRAVPFAILTAAHAAAWALYLQRSATVRSVFSA